MGDANEKIHENDKEASQTYYAEVLNLLQKANEPLRLSIMLLSMAATLNEEVPPIIKKCVEANKTICDRMQFLCLSNPRKSKDQLN